MFFMDHLKIYGKDPESIGQVLTLVEQGSAAVGMPWQKCGVAHMRKGKVVQLGNSMVLDEGELAEVSLRVPGH